MYSSQSNNTAGGDIINGPKNTYVNQFGARPSPLAALYARLRAADSDEHYTSLIADKLQHFCTQSTDGDVRGLADKLKAANREDLEAMAKRLKEDAAKLVARHQTSPIAQDIITMVLSKIYTDFVLHVTPAIQAEQPRSVIDQLISDRVVDSAMQMLGDNDVMLTDTDVLGLLFFLGGNCHIRWDKC